MSNFVRIFNYTKNRRNYKYILIAIVAIFVLIIPFFFVIVREPSQESKEDAINGYKAQIEFLKSELEDLPNAPYSGAQKAQMQITLQDKIDYYTYLVENNKTESEYYHIGGMSGAIINNKEGHHGSAFMFYIFKYVGYFVYALSVALPLMIFVSELGGTMKNIIATSLTRKEIYNGFYLEPLIAIVSLNILAFVIGLIGGISNPQDKCLIISNGFREVSTLGIYAWASLGRLVLCLLLLGIITMVGVKTKNVTLTSIYTLLIIATVVVIGVISSTNYVQPDMYEDSDAVRLLPIIGIEANLSGVTSKSAILIGYHFIAAIALYFGGQYYFRKMNI